MLTSTLLTLWHIFNWAIRIGALIVVPLRRPPAQARAWLFFMLLLPLPGLIAFFLFGRIYQPKRMARMRARINHLLTRAAEQWNDRSHVEVAPLPAHLQVVPTLVEALSNFPIMRGNAVDVLDCHPQWEDALISDIDAAVAHVHLLYYIFENDRTGVRVADAVARAARRGVKCRVLLDAVGAAEGIKHLGPGMREAGAQVVQSLPVGFFKKKTARYDLRNHRKIAIVDGCIGHVGSANVVEPELRKNKKCEEIVLRFRGPVVSQLQVVFLGDLYLELERRVDSDDVFPPIAETEKVQAHVLPSGPLHDFSHTRQVLTTLIHNANRRVCITTPYFIPDATYINAMQAAALRGVEVRLIVPERSDNRMVTYAQESFFEQLMSAGVHVHSYRPTLLHTKMITVDGEVAVVGSANMDIRSLDLNREISMLCYDRALVARLEIVENRYIKDAALLKPGEWEKRPAARRFLQNFARLFDSFL